VTEEQEGVIVACPSRSRSTASQPSAAAPVATIVVTQTSAAWPFADRAEPALKPNQPNHRSPAPSITNGRLCGRIGSRFQPIRLPSTIASARPAAPALMCTAVPPAKSMASSLLAIHPPVADSAPSKAKTQWATGKYTIVAQMPANSIQAPNFARSAMAPEMSATVMIAKTAWKATKAIDGIVNTRLVAAKPLSMPAVPSRPLRPKNSVGSPSRPPPTSLPKAIE
jgi:hypothetical protein